MLDPNYIYYDHVFTSHVKLDRETGLETTVYAQPPANATPRETQVEKVQRQIEECENLRDAAEDCQEDLEDHLASIGKSEKK